MNDAIIAGADIGGSHITVALIDTNTRKIVVNTRMRIEINSNRKAEEIFTVWAMIIKNSFKAAGIKPSKIGFAMPGPFDYINGISYIKDQNKYDALYGLNVKEKVAEKLGINKGNITIVNDAACFLKGEVFDGAGKGFARVMGLTLGTGLGSSRYLEGETSDAELWCSEYRDGIAEDYFSTRWFLKRYKEVSGERVIDVKELVSKIDENFLVQHLFDEFGRNLATFLSSYIKNEQLQLIILGGNISLAFTYFSKALKRTFDQDNIDIEIKPAELGENAALIGAASSHFLSSGTFKST